MLPGGGHPRFIESFGYALRGVRTGLAGERNIKVMLCAAAAAVVAGFVLRIDAISWVLVVLMIGAVLTAELLNTAVETIVDLASPAFHPLAGKAKDLAAGAVLVLSSASAIGGIIVYARAACALFGLVS